MLALCLLGCKYHEKVTDASGNVTEKYIGSDADSLNATGNVVRSAGEASDKHQRGKAHVIKAQNSSNCRFCNGKNANCSYCGDLNSEE